MYCPVCGMKNDDDSLFCQGCGNPVEGTAVLDEDRFEKTEAFISKKVPQSTLKPALNEAKKPNGKNLRKPVLVIVFVLLFLLIAALTTCAIYFSDEIHDWLETKGIGETTTTEIEETQEEDTTIEESATDTSASADTTEKATMAITSATQPGPVYTMPVFSSIYASSYLAQQGQSIYIAAQANDGNPRTSWVEGAAGDGIGEWIELSASIPQKVSGMKILIGFNRTKDHYYYNSRPKNIQIIFDDGSKIDKMLNDEYGVYQDVPFGRIVTTKTARLVLSSVYKGTKYTDTCIAEISFY